MQTLSALDSAFLLLEDDRAFLHIGSVAVFEGPPPSLAEVRDAIARKLPLVPRYRQRLLTVRGQFGRPVWVDDPDFELEFHVRRTRVRSPGGDAELQVLAGELMSLPLDHDRPLWEDWLVHGLTGGRWALVTKVHHSMVDGIAGTDLLTTVLDKAATPDEVPPDNFAPPPLPGQQALLMRAAREGLQAPYVDVGLALRGARHPRALLELGSATVRGMVGFAGAARLVRRTSLVGELGRRREFRWAEASLDDLRLVRESFGGTLNDVMLTTVTLAFQRLLVNRGEPLRNRAVRALVPVSVRHTDQHGQWDNRVSAILADLPVATRGSVAVLAAVSQRMDALKSSHEAEAGEVVTAMADLLPPQGLSAFLRIAFRLPQRVISTVATNVPGPRSELFLAGRRMLATYPYVPIADRLRIGVAVTSYGGRLLFGVTADSDSTPDVDVFRDGLVDALTELVHLARERATSPAGRDG